MKLTKSFPILLSVSVGAGNAYVNGAFTAANAFPVRNTTDTNQQERKVRQLTFRVSSTNTGVIYLGKLDTVIGGPNLPTTMKAGDHPIIIECPDDIYMNLNDWWFAATVVTDTLQVIAFESSL
jgi:hypothetical protein